jgi:dipeptidyl aminopeptidase/acylaminoacyl peptidase
MQKHLASFLLAGCISLMAQAQRKEMGNLVMENIPDIPQEIVDELDKYNNVRSASLADWSPDGKSILIVTRFGDVAQLHHLSAPGAYRKQLTFFKEPVSSAVSCPDKTKNGFVFFKDLGGNENYQFYWYDMKTSAYRLLTDGKSRNVNFTWNKAGTRYAYKSNKLSKKGMEIFISSVDDPSKDKKILPQADKGDWNILDWSSDDKWIILQKEVSVTESYLYLLNTETSALEPINDKPGKEIAYEKARFSKDGKSIYFISDEDAEFARLCRYSLADKKISVITTLSWDVTNFDENEKGTRVAFTTNEDGYSELYLLETATLKYARVTGLPRGIMGSLQFNPVSEDLGLTVNSPTLPGDVFILNTAKLVGGKATSENLKRWTFSEMGGLDEAQFVTPEVIRYPTFDSAAGKVRMIPAILYRPNAATDKSQASPVVINIHGGPEAQSLPYFSSVIQYLVTKLGVTVILPNVRGSTGYGKNYVKLDNGFLRENSVRDIGSLLDWIGTQPGLDKNRVGVMGGSYGGYMSLATMTNYNARMKLGIDIVGISNFVTFLKNTSEYRRDLRRVEYGDERDAKMNEFQQKISPNNNVQKITKPMFIIQGKNDPRVPVTEAEQMVEALKKNGNTVWYLMAKDEGHGFAKKQNRDFQNAAMILFLKEYLVR